MEKGQGALEYLLLIGGAVLVAVIVITTMLTLAGEGEANTDATASASAIRLCEQRNITFCGPGNYPECETDTACVCTTDSDRCGLEEAPPCEPLIICPGLRNCGSMSDGCTGTIDCGPEICLIAGETCIGNVCTPTASLCGGHTDLGGGNCEASLVATYGGYGVYDNTTSSYFKDASGINILSGYITPGPDITIRGFLEWDIFTIPDSSTINAVGIVHHGIVHGIDTRIRNFNGPRPSTISSAEDTYNYAGGSRNYNGFIAGFPKVGTGQSVTLNSNAITDLRSQLTNDFFAIGIIPNISSTGASSLHSDDSSTANPKPTLKVNYSP